MRITTTMAKLELEDNRIQLNELNEVLELIKDYESNTEIAWYFKTNDRTIGQINQKVEDLYNGVTEAQDLKVLCEFIQSATKLGIVTMYTSSRDVLKERLRANASDPAIIGLALNYDVMHIDDVLDLILDNGINHVRVLEQACNKVVAEKKNSQNKVAREDEFVIYLEEQEEYNCVLYDCVLYDCVLKIDPSKQYEIDKLKAIKQPNTTREQIIDLMKLTDKKNTPRFLKLSEYLLQIDRGIEVKKLSDFYKEMMNSETWEKTFSELDVLLDSNGAGSLRGYLESKDIKSPIELANKLDVLINEPGIQQTLEHALLDLVMLGMYPYLKFLYHTNGEVMERLNAAKTKFQKIRSSFIK